MSHATDFAEHGYAKLSLLGPDFCLALRDHYWANSHLHQRWPDLPGIKRMSVNDLPLMRLVHEATTPLVQEIVGEPIKPSYSFTANYERGSSLPRHTDRPQCKYNVTLILDAKPLISEKDYFRDDFVDDWPLYIEHNGKKHRITLDTGEAVVYSGTKDNHWRDEMSPLLDSVLGVFFHYVPQDFDGPLK